MRRTYPVLFFALMLLLAFWKPIFHPEFTLLAGGDMCSQTYPWLSVAAHWLRKGSLLLWDPYVFSGKATLGELQPGILYPLNWVVALLPAADGNIITGAIQGLILLHYFMAGLFCYCLARSFDLSSRASALAGLIFALGGYMSQVVGFVNIFSGFSWMPLALLAFRKALLATGIRRLRWIVGCGGALGLALLAGHHVPPIHAGLLLLLYAVFRAVRLWRGGEMKRSFAVGYTLAAVAALAGLMTAVQWLPSVEWARGVLRWAGEGDPVRWGEKIPYSVLQQTGNVSPQAALSLVLPFWSPDANLYVGLGVLFLASIGLLFARRSEARFFGTAALFYFFASWGQFSALHGWANTFVPGLWFAREVFHYLVPFQLCLALTAAWGLDCLVASYSGGDDCVLRRFVRRAGWGFGQLVLAAGILIAGATLWGGVPAHDLRLGRLAVLAGYAIALGFVLFLMHTQRVSASRAGLLLIVIVTVDLTSHISQRIPTVDRPRGKPDPAVAEYWKKSEVAERLLALRQQEAFRVDDPQAILPPNFGDAWRLEATMGHGATGLIRYLDFRDTGWGPGSNASALLNARYLVSRTPISWLEKVVPGEAAIYRNTRALPRVFVAPQYRAFAEDAQVLKWLGSPLMALQEEVLVKSAQLNRCAPEFLKQAREADPGIRVLDVAFQTAAQKEARELSDEAARAELHAYQPPWGWTTGDEIAVRLQPEKEGMHGYIVFRFMPLSASGSTLTIRQEWSGNTRDIAVHLPGKAAGTAAESSRRSIVDLGALEQRDYRISFIKTADCPARLEALTFASVVPPENLTGATAVVTSFRPNTIRLAAELERASFVVLSELMYPGWDAWVDGERVTVLTGNYLFRAVPVAAGKHEIVLRFRSRTFLLGLGISIATLLLCGVAIARFRR